MWPYIYSLERLDLRKVASKWFNDVMIFDWIRGVNIKTCVVVSSM